MKKKITKSSNKSNFLKDNSIAIIILARLDSKRLKNKAILKINDNNIIEILIKRLKKKFNTSDIILCTSSKKKNLVLKKFSQKNKIKFFRGSDKNIFKRIIFCQKRFKFKHFVRVTGDNPFTDLSAIEKLSKAHIKNENDYTYTSTIPMGTRPEIFSIASLKKCSKLAIDQNSSEYLTYFFKRNIFKIENYLMKKYFKDQDKYNISIDRKKDFNLLKKIIMQNNNIYFSLKYLIKMLKKYSKPSKLFNKNKSIKLVTKKYNVKFKGNLANHILL